jgi:hypothetical protein
MATECCGANRETPFCPDCGADLRKRNPLGSLLVYLKAQVKAQYSLANTSRRKAEIRYDAERARLERLAGKAEKNALKWQTWAQALEGLLYREE